MSELSGEVTFVRQVRVYPQFLTGVSLSEKQNKKMMLEVDTQVIQTVLRMLNVY